MSFSLGSHVLHLYFTLTTARIIDASLAVPQVTTAGASPLQPDHLSRRRPVGKGPQRYRGASNWNAATHELGTSQDYHPSYSSSEAPIDDVLTSMDDVNQRNDDSPISNEGFSSYFNSSPSSAGGSFCPVCSRRFPCRRDLDRHILVHTGERPFQCPHCSHRSNRKGNLKQHILNVHRNIKTE